jgi:hypothetical protein
MTITAKIIEDSIAPNGKRLTTFQLSYPRFIHAEAKTHRVLRSGDDIIEVLEEVSLMDDPNLSRNASSSRAIPVKKMIERTLADPAFFVHIGKNQPGMQAKEEVSDFIKGEFQREWNELGAIVAGYSERWATVYGIHKQVANRALEAWQHISVVVTATEWDNFYELRNHVDAQPEIHVLAALMQAEVEKSTPVLRKRDRLHESAWHLPYVSLAERQQHADDPIYLARLSSARCARTSYLNHDGSYPDAAKDIQLFLDLVGGRPLHASPTEHQGYPLPLAEQRSKNLVGWRQFRELVEHDIYAA